MSLTLVSWYTMYIEEREEDYKMIKNVINFNKEQAKEEIKTITPNRTIHENAINQIIENFDKNDTIKSLFNGTDGRIAIDVEIQDSMIIKESIESAQELAKRGYRSTPSNSFEECVYANISRILKIGKFSIEGNSIISKGADGGIKVTRSIMRGLEAGRLIHDEKKNSYSYKEMERIIQKDFSDKFNVSEIRKNKLVVSVLPQDFLRASEGVSWGSCINLNDGSYSEGAVSYANSHDMVVAYLISEKSQKSGILHKSLVWRQFFFINSDSEVLASSPYPSENQTLTDSVFKELLRTDKIEIEDDRDEMPRITYKNIRGYLDAYESSCNNRLAYRSEIELDNEKRVIYHTGGNTITCLACGETHQRLYADLAFSCSNC